jgi:hypothetical protein
MLFDIESISPLLRNFKEVKLTKEELEALKKTEGYDPAVHMEDGSIKGFSSKDQEENCKIILGHLNLLHPTLQAIVEAEMKEGNFVYGSCKDYPDPGSISITMQKDFTNKYQRIGVRYVPCFDPHYWRASYEVYHEFNNCTHLLIC